MYHRSHFYGRQMAEIPWAPRKYLSELFKPGDEIATFSDRQSMLAQIDYYSNHPEQRRRIAQAGRQRALSEHTYKQRLEAMLGYIYADNYERLKSRDNSSNWAHVLKGAEEHPELSDRFNRVFRRGEEPKLERLVSDIKIGQGRLTDTEQILLFLDNFMAQARVVNEG